MLDILTDFFRNIIKSRILPLVVIYLFFASLLIYKVFTIQVVEQKALTESTTEHDVITREIKATRGNIYDSNGVLLAYNKLSYNVTLIDLDAFKTNDDENKMIYKLVRLIEGNGDKITPDFYIKKNKKGKLVFTVSGAAENRFKRDAYAQKSVEELSAEQRNASAEEVYEHLRQGKYMFGISDEYNMDDTLKIMKIRFSLFLNTYNKGNPIQVAADVSERTVAAILENSPDLPGVEIVRQTHRYYNESKYFAHITGYTGTINDNELSSDEDGYYSASDQIGKTGLEAAFEKYLRGTKGSEEATLNSDYNIVDLKTLSEPVKGDDIYLTVDSKLQKACYHILEKNLATVLLSRIHNSANAGEKGKNSSKIMIPIYDVYNALISNNIINLKELSKTNSTIIEKQVYNKFKKKEKSVLKELKILLDVNSTVTKKEAGKEMTEYLEYLYDFIKAEEFIDVKAVDEENAFFNSYLKDEKSLAEFLKYSISNKWINLDNINIGSEYLSTEEIYDILIKNVFDLLETDTGFEKIVYKSLIYNYTLSGTELCLILFDQGVLKKDKKSYDNLYSGALSAYSFIRSKIKSLEITPAELALDPCSGSMVITDPESGKVKALVTYPSYDNNKLANQIDAEYYMKLQSDKSFPLINRPCQQKTAPGSTFKPISAAAALGNNVVGEHEKIHDDVVFDKTDKPATCWSNISHGSIDIRTAIEVSCNYFFYEMGYRMSLDASGKYNSRTGLSKLNEYAGKFGFKEGVTSGVELYEYEPSISDTDSVRSAIGQGSYSFTPTQIARYISCVANEGKLNYLTLIESIKDLDGKEVRNTVSSSVNKKAPKVSLTPQIWSVMRDGLYEVVNGDRSSYSDMFKNIKTIVAGKSGTAQFSALRGNHALFTSYAPYDKPEVSVTVVLPYAYTSSYAVMTAADFYEYYFGERDVESVVNKKADEGVNVINSD